MSMHLTRMAAVALAPALALALRASPAAAAPPEPQASLSDAEVTRRIEFIDARLRRGAGPANTWWQACYYGWTALTMGQFVVAIATTDPGLRTDLAVSAAASSLGVIPLGIFGFPARTAAADLAAYPGATPAERRRKLAAAERLLRASADSEAFGRSWMSHALSGGVSIGVGVVLGVVYKRPVSGVVNAVGGIALSELQTWTQPTAAVDDLRDYVRFTSGLGVPGARPTAKIGVTIVPQAGGLGISGWF